MMKKLTSLALALSLPVLSAAAFSGVDLQAYYAAPVAWAVKQGITTGTAEDTFSPEAPCTQGQILTFLWRSAGSPTPAAAEEEVSPLPPNFNAAIRWAREKASLRRTRKAASPRRPSAPGARLSPFSIGPFKLAQSGETSP